MSKVIINGAGAYFVEEQGFTGTSDTATKFELLDDAEDTIECLLRAGIKDARVEDAKESNIKQNEDGHSWSVSFIRERDQRADGTVDANQLNPSARRFRTRDEARHHATRFVKIEKHAGYHIKREEGKPVTAWVNKVSGKTNPVIGRGRVDRD